eukprot:3125063-Lingulodinium_polyedra.AAC.1
MYDRGGVERSRHVRRIWLHPGPRHEGENSRGVRASGGSEVWFRNAARNATHYTDFHAQASTTDA